MQKSLDTLKTSVDNLATTAKRLQLIKDTYRKTRIAKRVDNSRLLPTTLELQQLDGLV